MTSALKQLSQSFCHNGTVTKYSHVSKTLGCEMKFNVFMPQAATSGSKVPGLYFLSGLTCNEDNFITKAGAIPHAAKHNIALVCPDTSPRGVNIEGEDDSWDFGSGAGFYVDAVEPKWSKHYRMYSYVTEELPSLVNESLPIDGQRISIFGHSMGGHGALICALKNPGKYKSVSAFSPIANPINCPWGKKAFSGYLGENQEAWNEYDASELVKKYNGPALNILIDQGSEDQFYKDQQLLTENFDSACKLKRVENVDIRIQPNYDHSYWFIHTFIEDHLNHHAKFLCA
ncbi:hypothetical protein K7432_008800 [Basidiobolus ranarum]|uniref:S-formylglutathione hydrolase n=1 Tax=Basidiobolus ranarum TaxID=34480 RepID=A0ABR2VY00_9FUNG